MIVPKLETGKFSLFRAQEETGIVLNNDNSSYSGNGDNYFKVFESLEQLIYFVKNEINNSNIEYLVYDSKGDFVQIIK